MRRAVSWLLLGPAVACGAAALVLGVFGWRLRRGRAGMDADVQEIHKSLDAVIAALKRETEARKLGASVERLRAQAAALRAAVARMRVDAGERVH